MYKPTRTGYFTGERVPLVRNIPTHTSYFPYPISNSYLKLIDTIVSDNFPRILFI